MTTKTKAARLDTGKKMRQVGPELGKLIRQHIATKNRPGSSYVSGHARSAIAQRLCDIFHSDNCRPGDALAFPAVR